MDKLENGSLDITKVNVEKMKEFFPQVVTEGKINFDMLKVILGDEIEDNKEKYQITWNGKLKAIKNAQTASTSTLIPCKSESINWNSTSNFYIEGDNLEVLKQLQKTFYGKIKLIYIDPPYNTGNDFVYEDDFVNSIDNYKSQTNQESVSNPETSGRYHTDWLNMIYPRLIVARNLLKENGAIFISINEIEYTNLKKICDEIFGENNYVSTIHWQSKSGGSADEKYIVDEMEYILIYCRNKKYLKMNQIVVENDERYKLVDKYVNERGKYLLKKMDFRMTAAHYTESLNYPIVYNGKEIWPGGKNYRQDGGWNYRWSKEKIKWGIENGFVVIQENKDDTCTVYSKQYEKVDNNNNPITRSLPYRNLLTSKEHNTSNGSREIVDLFQTKVFEYAKPSSLIEYLLSMIDIDDEYVLDFFSGSSTTAVACMKRKKCNFIMVQLPEICDKESNAYKFGFKNICELARKRLSLEIEQIKKNNSDVSIFSDDEVDNLGFKVFKLDSTNIKAWDSENEYDETSIFSQQEVFKEDRTKEDVLYEIMLKYGLFDIPATEVDVNGKTMYRVGKRHMLVCLEDNITEQDVKAIGELSPRVVVFKESGFNSDNDKVNAVYNLSKAGVEEVKSV